MHIKVSANNTNGSLPGPVEWFDDIDRAKKHADWWHSQSAVCNVEITEPLGVQLTHANGHKVFDTALNMREAFTVLDSWKAVIANRKINRARVTSAQILGATVKTARATPEDALIGAWVAEALDNHLVLPSMKYDINRWIDSKDWT